MPGVDSPVNIPEPVKPPIIPTPIPNDEFTEQEATQGIANQGLVELPVKKKPKHRQDELSDLFEVPQPDDNDMYTDDLIELDETEDDLSDLTSVSREDIMGKPFTPKRPMRYKRSSKVYTPPTAIGGVSGGV